ncbi:hypothetical protein BV898_10646 [Hypsibius exemplaris]|uniref:Peroxin-19 n=1 Tax=Hypsibius exemplaris TaxID=2072580 RepID=A0A1W0WIS6_HYPEX|nr:hypothetical protein BV898_10646 [Hypsibius exemplaris]
MDQEAHLSNEISDLDKLLEEALADFSRPILLPSEKARSRVGKTTGDDVAVDGVSPSPKGAPQPKPTQREDTTSEEDAFLEETAREIDDVLSSIAQEDPALAKQLRNLTDCAAGVSSADHNVAMKSFSEFATMFKETLKNVSSQSGVAPEELLDEDLDGLMENLDKLAMGQPDSDSQSRAAGQSADDVDFSVPLNDVVKALLAKDVMYASLQRCEEEFVPWLATNRGTLAAADLNRYESQLASVRNLLREYEAQPDSGDASDEHFQRIFIMIATLQDLGAFPEQLMAKVNTDAFHVNLAKQFANDDGLEPPDCKTA